MADLLQKLTEAIRDSNLDAVKEILINEPALVQGQHLFDAAKTGSLEIVSYLVEYSRVSLNEYDEDHRNVLHYGAMSGNAEVFKYLTDKCGMDPLKGDKNLVTPWDIVKENGFKDIDEYLTKKYGHPYEDFYRNPIRSGFFPDPSICRVGKDYYMVNSSFIFFPCIPISHSTDLIHWEIIGHAITDPEYANLDELEGGRGYWAPDISFYEGRFYITATYRLNDVPPIYRRQIVVSSDKPQGPYGKPVFIDEDGIDPSIFNDDDGKRYMLLNRGARIFELDKNAGKKISDAKLLFYGDHKRAPEGPHLYKKDGYYYLLEAEGGTGAGHRVTVSRSKDLFGNYEVCPYNPIMRQEDTDAAIQRCGHGDLVETDDGRWYMVYLCGRMVEGGYSILGRETAIDPVTWTADGWPIVNNLKGPSCMQLKPYPNMGKDMNKCVHDSQKETGISPCGLPFEYMTPRPFEQGAIKVTGGGNAAKCDNYSFVIRGSKAPLSDVRSRNILLRRQTSFSFEYTVKMEIPQMSEGQSAGITGYYDENTYLTFGLVKRGGKNLISLFEHVGDEDKEIISDEEIPGDAENIELAMSCDYLKRTFSYATDGNNEYKNGTVFASLSNVYYLCDEGIKKGKRFTGALVGMYCYSGSESDLFATFKNPEYKDI